MATPVWYHDNFPREHLIPPALGLYHVTFHRHPKYILTQYPWLKKCQYLRVYDRKVKQGLFRFASPCWDDGFTEAKPWVWGQSRGSDFYYTVTTRRPLPIKTLEDFIMAQGLRFKPEEVIALLGASAEDWESQKDEILARLDPYHELAYHERLVIK